MEFLFLTTGIILGFITAWFIKKPKQDNNELLQNELLSHEKNLAANASAIEYLTAEKEQLQQNNQLLQQEILKLNIVATEARSNADNLTLRLDEQKQEFVKIKEQMTKEFENLANKIFEDKSEKFASQNKNSLDQILSPLKERIKDFEDKVQQHYENENKEKATLKEQINMLHQLNQQMSKEAQNLTKALKGDNKAQGNWGEFILESILEKSGLVKDREYLVQPSYTNEEGKRFQPDIIINLPESKHLIVDSKVSLIAYDKFVSAATDEEIKQAVKEHLLSLRQHIKGLSEKSYQTLYQLKSLDFVLLFIPIEPAFALAVQNDQQLFNDAFEKNIVVVSPSTLLATLRTVASIWRQEQQNRNAVEIARKAGDLYDKFNGFVEDMIDMGKKLDGSKKSYEQAMKKLSEGNGNIVKKIEELKKMGATATKSLPANLIERAGDS